MTVTVNGEPVALAGPTTLAGLLHARDCARPGIAVALNGEVVPRLRHDDISVADGDVVEIVTAVQGG